LVLDSRGFSRIGGCGSAAWASAPPADTSELRGGCAAGAATQWRPTAPSASRELHYAVSAKALCWNRAAKMPAKSQAVKALAPLAVYSMPVASPVQLISSWARCGGANPVVTLCCRCFARRTRIDDDPNREYHG
jgi:hypothetical protein